MLKKATFEELEIGKTYYFQNWDCTKHEPFYSKVKILDKDNAAVYYQYEDGWKEYQRPNQFVEIGLYKEDGQMTLF